MPSACLCTLRLDPIACSQDAAAACQITQSIRTSNPELGSWINFPLVNASGSADEVHLTPGNGQSLPTSYSRHLPHTMNLLHRMRRLGVHIRQARVAVLLGRDVLKAHVDQYKSIRYILALNEQGTDFRHVFLSTCFCMHTGQLWRVDGGVCHGAANVGETGMRLAVVIDASPGGELRIQSETIPGDQVLTLPRFTPKDRSGYDEIAWAFAQRGDTWRAERVWHFLPFEYAVPAVNTYHELLAFAERNIARSPNPEEREFWTTRAQEILMPSLPFEVAPLSEVE